ncbi:MAG TPA: HAD-IIIA family hydrolase [Acidimicrobiales bacterium]|nr:HAD-IIIA family hydrolase [Acidimicrobiales bacterium]
MKTRPTVFFDRDGVLIENLADHVPAVSDVHVLAGAFAAVRRVREAGYTPIVVSNELVVGLGIVSAAKVATVHRHVVRLFADAGAPIDFSYLCPHAPADACGFHKPRPGLLTYAAERLGIALDPSVMIGDALTDISAARAVGVPSVLVFTGRGMTEHQKATAQELADVAVVASVVEAAEHIIVRGTKRKEGPA